MFPCLRYDDNKTLSHKIIRGGNMRVGTLVRTIYPNTKVGIVMCIDPSDLVKCCFGWVHKEHLEVICE